MKDKDPKIPRKAVKREVKFVPVERKPTNAPSPRVKKPKVQEVPSITSTVSLKAPKRGGANKCRGKSASCRKLIRDYGR